ncbi:ABC transporter permease subunit [Macrococcus armenti]|uniref:ABC transporter permease n=1 Tax=Macrococcus armenti TaxID=2875764 RepID=A0ABY3ZVI9_9STAP|nr:ABC transporter permease subunit [Macrococcus armenti]UOB20394.1 ABC transporter permease [Macrococcus armenti]
MNYMIKEFIESYRSKGLWLMMFVLFITSIFILSASKSYPADLGFATFLLNLFDMNMMILPIFAILISALSVFNEKESKSLAMILTKKDSMISFLFKKSLAIQSVMNISYIGLAVIILVLAKLIIVIDFKASLVFLMSVLTLLLICNQIGIFVGMFSKTKLELMAYAIIIWFVLVFLLDLIFLYIIPFVTYDNAKIFGIFYFLDPMHTIRIFLEHLLGLLSTSNLSALMSDVIKLNPVIYMALTVFLWPLVIFGITVLVSSRGEAND